MLSLCHRNVVAMPGPPLQIRPAMRPLVPTRNLCPQAYRKYLTYDLEAGCCAGENVVHTGSTATPLNLFSWIIWKIHSMSRMSSRLKCLLRDRSIGVVCIRRGPLFLQPQTRHQTLRRFHEVKHEVDGLCRTPQSSTIGASSTPTPADFKICLA